MGTPRIIGLTGYAGSGKSTVASYLVKHHKYYKIPFAGPLKEMLRCIGLTEEQLTGSLKEVPCPVLNGKTPRYAMKTIGTEWGRQLIDPDIWVNAWRRMVLGHTHPIVADDVRFPNEARMVRLLGGIIIRVCRNDIHSDDTHQSEVGQSEINADVLLQNNGTVVGLEEGISGILLDYAFRDALSLSLSLSLATSVRTKDLHTHGSV